ncbi:hypothetical protein CEE45_04095 [Candidatus Heimdallarchaeota archaeon B3_Heim]|nr:MAG: hypothetical protein CEE45_04095 [Candidatus Heimdallarchaeota archaeon B3_Heim]
MRIKSTLASTRNHAIESLVKAIFKQTMRVVQRRGISFGVISPSQEIIDLSLELGADFTYIDEGTDLNKALSQASKKLPPTQAVLIIMPDLPFFSVKCLHVLLKRAQNVELLIVPSISGIGEKKGTAMLYMRHPELLPFSFGLKSKNRYVQSAQMNHIEFEILDLDPCARDLDTPTDVKYLQNHLSSVNEPENYKKFLEQIFN